MAYNNPTFNPRIQEYENITAPQQGYGSQHGRTDDIRCGSNKTEDDANTYQELSTLTAAIYQERVTPTQIDIITRPVCNRDRHVQPGVFLPMSDESVTDETEEPESVNRWTTNEVRHQRKNQNSNAYICGDTRRCIYYLSILLALLFFLVLALFLLVVLHLVGNIGPQHNKQMNQAQNLLATPYATSIWPPTEKTPTVSEVTTSSTIADNKCSSAAECHSNAFCANDMGIFNCRCNPGYFGDGKSSCKSATITVQSSCGKQLKAEREVSLLSPNYPNVYNHSTDCYWIISSPERVSLTFKTFHTEKGSDFLFVYDGGSPVSSKLIGQYSGVSIPPPVSSTSHQLYVKFITDASNNHKGFLAIIKALQFGSVRLVGGTDFAGRVEVYYNGTWGTVCNNSWNMNDANVVCRQLGFPGAVSAQRGHNCGQGTGKIWLGNVQCLAFENYLVHCAHNGWGCHRCDHSDDSFVECKRAVRLVGGNDTSGTVEVFYEREWLPLRVCDSSTEDKFASASVVCKELGFFGVIGYCDQTEGTRALRLHGVKCSGDEKSILDCHPSNWNVEVCSSNKDFCIHCSTVVRFPECLHHRLLSSPDRNIAYKVSDSNMCDTNSTFLTGWYRFTGAAGTRLPTSCTPDYRCVSAATSWMGGSLPAVSEGQVSRMVYFSFNGTCRHLGSYSTQVRNCGPFFVYNLKPISFTCYRHCGVS